jgi:hypothetical protein
VPPTEAAPSRRRRGALWSLASYAALFAVLLLPRGAVTLDRISREGNVYDAHLIAWILSWVAHALGTAPGTLFDANINHPAPAQLTGSDHLFSSQILFAPVYWLTGHPVLATGVVAFLTYPLAAFAMERLLRALGCSAAVA